MFKLNFVIISIFFLKVNTSISFLILTLKHIGLNFNLKGIKVTVNSLIPSFLFSSSLNSSNFLNSISLINDKVIILKGSKLLLIFLHFLSGQKTVDL